MELLIVTGMSGAGKSQAANALEDMGYYCVDNIPPAIIPSFVNLSEISGEKLSKLAIVTDARGGNMFSEINDVLKDLKKRNLNYKVLFLDSSNDVIIRRYKENRRKHPLADSDDSILTAVEKEREMLNKIRLISDYIVVRKSCILKRWQNISTGRPESNSEKRTIEQLNFVYK